ncbi:MAG: thiol:disulfide interchange protein DsbA/DsbL [Candidatus Thioglobus sp.]|nr:thiol:disulfide interchange protein DsbA/DsbL [Candidatus Thioglobus pontius]MBL6977040.1 thiol:disulfide interchange protein DsbA/DsbL [Candidatus Thioglobus sp.]MBL6984500.1 thiol:disulfide interchange protein DsbA/DsbL [Candidatus Thioglobus sp.]
MTKTRRLLAIFLLTFSTAIFANSYVEGKNYIKLDKPVKTANKDKVEVRELFWYYCPHCFNVEPILHDWVEKLPSNVDFVRQPAVFSDRWINGAIFYYVLEQLGEVDRLHARLFDAIHLHKTAFIDQEDFVEWLSDQGVDKTKANNAFKSFSVRVKVNKSKINTVKYHTSGVPAIVINGKYWTDASHAGGEFNMFKVADYLIAKESK